ncbi:glycosyl hydrolase 53 family protein [Streptomyces sp. NPDC020951]|uniref:glycosyl hydrolase 53 family protein n=1 Tax=Streptomyces sp. NPDC020951 TaxID=3365104 RepID=UPI0037884197
MPDLPAPRPLPADDHPATPYDLGRPVPVPRVRPGTWEDTPPIFVINLDRDRERLAAMSAHLGAWGVKFTRWPATDGSTLADWPHQPGTAEHDGVVLSGFDHFALPEAACGISHIRLWRTIVEHRIPWALVLEDDARLTRQPPSRTEEWRLPQDADIVLLNKRATPGATRHEASSAMSYADVVGGAGTEGYLVSWRGARKLLAVTRPLLNPLDFQMYAHFASVQRADTFPFLWSLPRNEAADEVALNAYRLAPSLVDHADTRSSIGNGRHRRARFLCRALLGLNFDVDGYYPYQPTAATALPARVAAAPPVSAPVPGDIAEADFVTGADLSHCPVGTAAHVAATLAEHGVTTARISLWVSDESTMNLARTLRLATAATNAGLGVHLVLHYSDTWADPGRQNKPAAWRDLSIGALRTHVRTYTSAVLTELADNGTPPAIVQLGNEITNGLLWAEKDQDERAGGRLHPPDFGPQPYWESDDQWVIVAELLNAGAAGVRAVLPRECRTMVHLDRGADIDGARWWLEHATRHEICFDLIGLSFHALWHTDATLARLGRIADLHATFPGKPVVITETSHPYRQFRHEGTTRHAGPEFPFTPDGQAAFLAGALRTVRDAPNGGGVMWWGTCFTDNQVEDGVDAFYAQALFDEAGTPMPALAAFRSAHRRSASRRRIG